MPSNFSWTALRNRWVIFVHDLAWVPLAIGGAYFIRFNLGAVPDDFVVGAVQLAIVALPLHAVTFWFFGCYRGIWLFASVPDLVRLAKAVVLGGLLTTAAVVMITRLEGVPRSVLLAYPLILLGALASMRIGYRATKDHGLKAASGDAKRALVVGAGRAGELLVRDLISGRRYVPVGIIDDDRKKLGHEIHGVRVRGRLRDLVPLVEAFKVDVVLIAMPSATRARINQVAATVAELGVDCRTLPSITELAGADVTASRLRPVTVRDLLGREQAVLDEEAIRGYLKGKCVVVTGGGGSIGSELCRQVALHRPSRLVVMDLSEHALFWVERELRARFPALRCEFHLTDVKNRAAVDHIFRQVRPEVVFHAAAFKHVPLVEQNPVDGIANNLFGTKVVAEAAHEYGIETFVLISTDKVVNPSNVMGATKRAAELVCRGVADRSETRFVTTRFGNVLGSAGSVVPLFEQQIRDGGPVTVTHPEVKRYFMTIEEAVGLILQAGAMGQGGEILVLDMGEPVHIRELAEKMIRLSGLLPEKDVEIRFTGLRAGEKLEEELFYEHERLVGTGHPQILLASSEVLPDPDFERDLDLLDEAVAKCSARDALERLQRLVPEFSPKLRDPADATKPGLRVIR